MIKLPLRNYTFVIISVVLKSVKRCFEQQISQHMFGSSLS